MTVDSFHVDPDGVRRLARVQSDVASSLHAAIAAADAQLAGFGERYGPIAAPAHGPLAAIIAARDEVLAALSGTSDELADRLSRAAHAYERGDEAEATALDDAGRPDR